MPRPHGKRTVVNKLGRKDKLTVKVRLSLVDSARRGLSDESACALAGITPPTLWLWRRRAENGEDKFLQLFKEIKRAEAEFEKELVQSVVSAAKDRQVEVTRTEKLDEAGNVIERITTQKSTPSNWQAAMRALERRYPEAWGKRESLNISATTTEVHRSEVEVNATLNINVNDAVKYLDVQELTALESLLEKISRGESKVVSTQRDGNEIPAISCQPIK